MAKAYWIATYRSIRNLESVAAALAAYESPAYQAARKILGDGAVRDIRIVEGME